MRAISTQAQFTSFRSRSDGSIGFSGVTPELVPAEMAVFFALQNMNVTLLIKPSDVAECELTEVKGEFETKTCSQRLRAVLFVWWQQSGENGDFEDFYRTKMTSFIDKIKAEKLKPE